MSYAKITFTVQNPETPFETSGAIGYGFGFLFDGVFCPVASSDDGVTRPTATPPQFGKGDGYFLSFFTNLANCVNTKYVQAGGKKFTVNAYSGGHGSGFIEMTATEYGHTFGTYPIGGLPNFSPIIGVVTAEVVPSNLTITNIQPIQAYYGEPKNTRVTYYLSANNYTSPLALVNPPSGVTYQEFKYGNVLAFNYERQHSQPAIKVIDSLDVESTNTYPLPRIQTWDIDVVNIAGQTATIIPKNVGVFDIATTLTYSMNGVNFQQSPSFDLFGVGEYTAYILDSLGGLWSKQFSVLDTENKPAAFVDISDVNAIQYRDNAMYGNYKSLLARQKYANIEKRCFVQKFRDNPTPTVTQIRTSYDNITAILDGDLSLPVTKVVTNLSLRDWRDCTFLDGGLNKTYVLFESGKVYNPETGVQSGSYNNVVPNGIKLDDWQGEGNLLQFTFGQFMVTSTSRIASTGAMVLVIDIPFNSFVPEICKTTYNKEDWNVHEFSVDMGLLSSDIEHAIEVTFEDDAYPTVIWPSEPFVISDDSLLVEFEYSGDQTISDMIPTGIKHKLFLEAQFYEYEPVLDIETFEDDRMNDVTLKRSLGQNIMLKTHAIPSYLANKIGLASLYKTIKIDGIEFEPVNAAKTSSLVEKNNPFLTLVQAFRPINSTAISNQQTSVINKVLGASSATVIGV